MKSAGNLSFNDLATTLYRCLRLAVEDPIAVDQLFAEFLTGGSGGFDQLPVSTYRALADVFDREWLSRRNLRSISRATQLTRLLDVWEFLVRVFHEKTQNSTAFHPREMLQASCLRQASRPRS